MAVQSVSGRSHVELSTCTSAFKRYREVAINVRRSTEIHKYFENMQYDISFRAITMGMSCTLCDQETSTATNDTFHLLKPTGYVHQQVEHLRTDNLPRRKVFTAWYDLGL